MPIGIPSTEIRPKQLVCLDRELRAKLERYHKSIDPDRPAADTIRELLNIALTGPDATTGVLIAARKIGAARAKGFVLGRITEEMHKVMRDLQAVAAEADANAFAEAQLAVRAARDRSAE